MQQFILPRLRDMLFLAIFSAAIMLGPRMLNQDGDLLRHLTMGRYIINNGSIPTKDIFSYTITGKSFSPHEWLAGVFFFGVYTLFGLNGIVIFIAGILALTFTILFDYGASNFRLRLPVFFLLTWGAAISSLHWIARPHIFTMFFLAIWLILADKLNNGDSTKIWLFPILMLVWVNTHGEFIAGFLVLIAYLAGWLWDTIFRSDLTNIPRGTQIGIALLLSLMSSLINPVGLRIWSTILGFVNNKYLIAHTDETNPPDFLQFKFLVLLAFIAFSLLALALNRSKITSGQAFLLVGFTIMSLTSARNVHLYGIVAPFVMISAISGIRQIPFIDHIETFLENIENNIKGRFWQFASVLVSIFLLATTPLGNLNRFDPAFFPVQAVTWLKQNPQHGNMFNAFDWGGYLLFNLWPEKQVFIDSQTDVYGAEFTGKYEQVITLAPGWQDVLNEYAVTWVIIPPNWPLAQELSKMPEWHPLYRDETAIILTKIK